MDLSALYLIAAAVCAGLVSFTTTPLARVFAYKVGAIDIPKDDRRMHKEPIPRIGGLAIFAGFVVASLAFCRLTPSLISVLIGGLIIVALGVLDDIFRLNAWIKFIVEIGVAFIPVANGLTIEFINLFGDYVTFGVFAIPVTVLWIVGLTNAINLIDGLDGLSCGVSAICSLSLMLCSALLIDNYAMTLLAAVLAGSCIGFLPFNHNPAKIFMGDTGALFLGYTLSVLSIDGLFKTHTALSFVVPLSIFGLPLCDTLFAFVRRIAHGQSPFTADRKHIHHKLIDIGFTQRQTVYILYSVCGLLGISAVMFTTANLWKALFIIGVGLAVFGLNYYVITHQDTREKTGFDLPPLEKKISTDEKSDMDKPENNSSEDSLNGEK